MITKEVSIVTEKQNSRKCACGAKLNRWGEHRTVPRYNPAGGGKAAAPGGYERQHRQLFGVGTMTLDNHWISWAHNHEPSQREDTP